MITFEIKRDRPLRTVGDVVRDARNRAANALGFNVDPLAATREANQHALAEGTRPEPLVPRFTRPNEMGWVPQAQRERMGLVQSPQQGPHWEQTAIVMGKQGYNNWLNHHVYSRFPKGTVVTLRIYPFVLGNLPPQIWEVIEIQEMYFMANMDREIREPKAVGLWALGTNRIPTYYPPGKLRPLTHEEYLHFDRLRNQAPNRGRPPSIGREDDPATGTNDSPVDDGSGPPSDAGERS
jgi:hypothetical protein